MKIINFFKIIGILLLGYILYSLDYNLVLHSFENLNYFFILLYVVVYFIYFSIKTYKWFFIHNHITKRKMTYKMALYTTIETQYLGFVTPGKVGDVLKLFILKEKFGIKKSNSFLSYTCDRFQDLFFMSMFAIIGITFFIDMDSYKSILYFLLFFLSLVYVFRVKLLSLVSEKLISINKENFTIAYNIKLILINLSIFLFYGLQVFFLAKALNIDIQFHIIAFIAAISSIIALVPITVMGLGLREGSFIYLLSAYSVSKESAVILSLLDNIVFYLIFIALLHIFNIFYLKKRMKFKSPKKS